MSTCIMNANIDLPLLGRDIVLHRISTPFRKAKLLLHSFEPDNPRKVMEVELNQYRYEIQGKWEEAIQIY